MLLFEIDISRTAAIDIPVARSIAYLNVFAVLTAEWERRRSACPKAHLYRISLQDELDMNSESDIKSKFPQGNDEFHGR